MVDVSQDRWGMAGSDSEISGQLLVKTINIGSQSVSLSKYNAVPITPRYNVDY